MVVKPSQPVWERILARLTCPPSSIEEWNETDEHGQFIVKRYPTWGVSSYDKDAATIHLFLGGIPEKTAYHELIHRAQSKAPELQRVYKEFKGGWWGRARNANPEDYYGRPIEQMAHAGADVEWHHYRGCSKPYLQLNCRDTTLFELPRPDPKMCVIPDAYDHKRHEEGYFAYVVEYIDLLPTKFH